MSKSAYSWDMGVDYTKAWKTIEKRIKELRPRDNRRAMKQLAYYITYLIQLRNACRISEAREAVLLFTKDVKAKEVHVQVMKQRNKPDIRLVVLPKMITSADLMKIRGSAESMSVDALIVFCKRALGWNTHSFRYSYITKEGKKGTAPQVIGKTTHHRKLDFILDYTGQQSADDHLRDMEEP